MKFLKNYGLSITLFVLFALSWIGQALAQWAEEAQNAAAHGEVLAQEQFWAPFMAATFENWQSEFLQLFTFVVLTAFLIHKGSHESKDSNEEMQRSLDRIERKLGELK